jgi:chromosome segregation ATPase
MSGDEDVVPLAGDHHGGGFDVVLRGYDKRQVEDYIERVELALGDADRVHREDGERLTALEDELMGVKLALGDAERRAAGLPEPLSQVGERIATMLRLAEEEADELVAHARERAEKQTAERTAELDRREADIAGASAAADQTRIEAQRDAEALRDRAQQEADELTRQAKERADELLASAQEEVDRRRRTAEEDVEIISAEGRARADEMIANANHEVAELAHQRDVITRQLDDLRQTLAAAARPLGISEPEA